MIYGLDLRLILIIASGFAGIMLVVLLIYIAVLHHRLNRLMKKYELFMKDGDGKSVEAKLREDVLQLRELSDSLDLLHATQKDILSVQNQCLRKLGFVKYNAFDNIGNNLSFALTILDGKNDGFCLSSVYGRNESRIFAKPVKEGKCMYSMSEEEKESLDAALQSAGDDATVKKQ
jgi:hypothetical protein